MTHTELHDLPRQPERKISSLKIPKPLHSLPRGRRCPGGRKVGAVGGAAHGEERGRGARREIELQQRHVVGPRAELPARAAAPRLAPPPRSSPPPPTVGPRVGATADGVYKYIYIYISFNSLDPHSLDFADFKKKQFGGIQKCFSQRVGSARAGGGAASCGGGAAQAEPEGRAPSAGLVTRRPRD